MFLSKHHDDAELFLFSTSKGGLWSKKHISRKTWTTRLQTFVLAVALVACTGNLPPLSQVRARNCQSSIDLKLYIERRLCELNISMYIYKKSCRCKFHIYLNYIITCPNCKHLWSQSYLRKNKPHQLYSCRLYTMPNSLLVSGTWRGKFIGMVTTRWPWMLTMVHDLVDLIPGVPLPGLTPLIFWLHQD